MMNTIGKLGLLIAYSNRDNVCMQTFVLFVVSVIGFKENSKFIQFSFVNYRSGKVVDRDLRLYRKRL